MSLAAITRVTQDAAGNAVTGAVVEIRQEISGAPLVQLYSDRAGTVSVGNPYTAAASQFTLYAAEGVYRIDVTASGATATERYFVALEDVPGEATLQEAAVNTSPYAMSASDDVIKVTTSGAAITINLVSAVGRTRPVKIVDVSGNAGTNPITITANGTETIFGAATYVINFAYGSIELTPDQTGKWYS